MAFILEFEDTFDALELDRSRWSPYYLPHWTERRLSVARFDVGGGVLRLRIDSDQSPWCPELDGEVRVSSLQTGAFAGPAGSRIGQHRFNPDAIVREEQPNIRLYTPRYGRIELQARATDDPQAMATLWMIGYEDEPERSAEICVCEIFGRDVAADRTVVGVGVHPFGDPTIVDDFSKEVVGIDARESHVYAAEWLPDRVTFFVDGDAIKRVDQSPTYPMQLMLGLYGFTAPAPGCSPEFVVESVRGYRLAD